MKLIREILPQAKKLGVLYNPGEAPSQYGVKKIRERAPELGFELVEGAVNSTAEVQPVAANLAGQVDVLFVSSDNTVNAGIAGAVKVALETKKPLFVGDSGTVQKGGMAAVSVGYSRLGRETGILVDRVLRGERDIPVVTLGGDELYINKEAASRMGVSLPASVLARAKKVYDTIEQ